MRTLYHPAMYDRARPTPSYWEATAPAAQPHAPAVNGDVTASVAVIGGGLTGLSCALHLARDHGIAARVLEAGPIGWGASSRAGGFVCFGATKLGLAQSLARFGEDGTRALWRAQAEAIELVEALAEDEAIDYWRQGDGQYELAHKPSRYRELTEEREALARYAGVAAELLSAEVFAARCHGGGENFGALHIKTGFGLHPLRWTWGLADAARRHGAKLHAKSPVVAWRREGSRHRLITPTGSVLAERVVVATNGYTADGLLVDLDGRPMPVISNIIVTRPLTDGERAAVPWHSQTPIANTRIRLFYYRLLPDNRLLFGARGDTTGRPEHGAKVAGWMHRRLGELFPPLCGIAIDYTWRGLVCLLPKLSPAVGRSADDASVLYGLGYHGNGMAMAPWTGRLLARLLAGEGTDTDLIPAALQGVGPSVPWPSRRLCWLRLSLAWYGVQDRL